jgi:hypothetical protein
MADLNQVLSQDDIDNMVSKNATKHTPAPHSDISVEDSSAQVSKTVSISETDDSPNVIKQNPTPPPKMVNETQTTSGKHEVCIAAGEIQSLGKQIFELTNRLAKIEASINKIESRSKSLSDSTITQIKSAAQQMKNVSSQVEIITEGLRGTAGYNLNKTFKCSSCKSTGVVAIKVRCTQCGQENWWGWWPKKK